MFGSLSSLLDNIPPNPNLNVLKMSIGEPQLGPPDFIKINLMIILITGENIHHQMLFQY